MQVVGSVQVELRAPNDALRADFRQAKVESDKFAASTGNVRQEVDALGDSMERTSTDATALTRSLSDGTKDVGQSFHLTGIEVATTANHLKTAALAAYVLSPAFRSFANPVIVASLRAMGPAAVSAAGTVVSALSPALSFLSRIALPIYGVVTAFKAMNAITELGADKIKEFGEIASGAGRAGVSTDFFQRQTDSAKDFSIAADKATDALVKFNTESTPKLGGSSLQSRLDELTKAGNFSDNTGVAAFKNAANTEERYRAIVSLITQAMEQGERLAALDLAARFLPPEILDRLRASGSALKDMQDAADKLKATDIISAQDIGYALELKKRLDDAYAVLNDKFKPIQKDLAQLGLNYQESWIGIVEVIGKGVSTANALYSALKGIPDILTTAGNSDFFRWLNKGYTPADLERAGIDVSPEAGKKGSRQAVTQSPAAAELGGLMQNPQAMRESMQLATEVSTKVQGDLSKTTDAVKKTRSEFDVLEKSIQRQAAAQEAEAAAVGKSVGEHARLTAEFRLLEAAQQDGKKVTEEMAERIKKVSDRMAEATQKAATMRVALDTSFQTAQLGRTDTEQRVAEQLRALYGEDFQSHMNDAIANQMRFNSVLADAKSVGESALSGFLKDLDAGKSKTEILTNVMDKLKNKLFDIAANQVMSSILGYATGGGLSSLFGGGTNAGNIGGTAGNLAALHHTGWGPGDPIIVPRYHDGVGPGEHRAIIRSDESVMTPGQMRAAGHGGAVIVNVMNAPGGTTANASSRRDASGGLQIDVFLQRQIEDTTSALIASGQSNVNTTLERRYGLSPRL